jgi:branched-chain amino acid transport system permease protein
VKALGFPTPLGLLSAFLITAVMGVLIGSFTIRLGGIFASCMCWFVSLALLSLARNLVGLTGGSSGYSATFFFDGASYEPYFYLVFAFLFIIYAVLSYIINSKAGLAFRAIGMDNEAAGSCGINHVIYKIFNFSLSCGVAGLVGGLYIHFVGIMTPGSMSNDRTIEIMAISFIGGRGTLWGSVLSAVILIPLLELSRGLLEWRQILYGLLMVLIMIFYPYGLAGLLTDLKRLIHKLVSKIGKNSPAA